MEESPFYPSSDGGAYSSNPSQWEKPKLPDAKPAGEGRRKYYHWEPSPLPPHCMDVIRQRWERVLGDDVYPVSNRDV